MSSTWARHGAPPPAMPTPSESAMKVLAAANAASGNSPSAMCATCATIRLTAGSFGIVLTARVAPGFGELAQLAGFEVGHRPQRHAVFAPVHDVIALPRGGGGRLRGAFGYRPHVEVDPMLVALVDQRRNRPA